jgi:anti-sigma B factor antagonist
MKITHEDYEQLTVIKLPGDLATEQVEALRQLVRLRLAKNTRDFVLDCTAVEFIDSQGLETLLWMQEECGQKLGQVRVAGTSPNVDKILHVTRLTARVDRHETVEAAVKSLRI